MTPAHNRANGRAAWKEREERRRARASQQEKEAANLPSEMTAAGERMELDLEHRRVVERQRQIRQARLKPYKMFAVKALGGETKP